MRLVVHRGQVLLLLVVGILAGVAVAGVCVQLDGISVMGSLHLDQVFAPAQTQMPSEIVIGRPAAVPSNDSALAASARPGAAAVTSPVTSPVTTRPTAGAAVVPGDVYAYPPGNSGRGGPGSGGGGADGGGGGGHGSGRSGG